MTDLLAELFADLGRLAWDPFWMPITAWTLLAAIALAVIAFVPAREVFLRRDLHFALLLALPAGLVASKVLGGIPGANLLRTWWQGPALVAPVTPPEMTVSPVFEQDPAGIVSIGAPVLEPSIDPAIWIGLGTLLAALVACVALVLLLVAVVRLRRMLSGATPDGELRLANGREVRILRCDRVQVPFSCGVFRPMIVLPDGPLPDRDVIVAHEAAHHEHRDVARLWSAGLVHAAFAFHPLVHLLSSRLTWLMEAACDRATLERTGLPASRYSEVLLRAVPQSAPRELRMALPMGRSVKELRSRIAALGHATNPARRGRVVSVGSMGVFAASMLLVAAAGIAATEAPALATSRVTASVGGGEADLVAVTVLADGRFLLDGEETSLGIVQARLQAADPSRLVLSLDVTADADAGDYFDMLSVARISGVRWSLGADGTVMPLVLDPDDRDAGSAQDFGNAPTVAADSTRLFLDMDAEGALRVDGRPTSESELVERLGAADTRTARVSFRVDPSAPSAVLKRVLRLLHGTGAAVVMPEGSILRIQTPGPTAATGEGRITGRVTDGKTGGSVRGALVYVNELHAAVSTHADGSYSFSGIPPGTYTVRLDHEGSLYNEQEVKISGDASVRVDFRTEGTRVFLEVSGEGVLSIGGIGVSMNDLPTVLRAQADGDAIALVVFFKARLGRAEDMALRSAIESAVGRASRNRYALRWTYAYDALPRDPIEIRQGTVRGRVTRADNGEPLLGASIFVAGTRIGSMSGPNGEYVIQGVPAGRQEVVASYLGFVPTAQRDVNVPDDGTVVLNFALNPQTYPAGEVTVTPPPPVIELPPPALILPPDPDLLPPQPARVPQPGVPVNRPGEPETFVIVEQMPELIGGLDELRGRVVYPDLARRAGIEGRVIVQFVVDTDGKVVDPVIVRGIGSGCDEEALRVVRTATFKPGMQRGLPVRVKMSLPIIFDLDGEDAPPPPPREPGVSEPGRPANPPGEPIIRDFAGNTTEVFVIVEQMPELIGGLDGLQSSMVYPEIAAKAGVQGRVIVQFIVMPDGSVFGARVVRGIGAGCDEEALRVVRTARFSPGKQRDVAVPVKMSLPITFKLAEDRGEPDAPSLRDEPFTGEIEVFTDASDVGRPFYVQVYGGPVEAYGSLAEKERMAIEVGRQNRCNAVLIGTVDRGPRMGWYADENPGLRDLRPGQWVGIRYLKQTPEN